MSGAGSGVSAGMRRPTVPVGAGRRVPSRTHVLGAVAAILATLLATVIAAPNAGAAPGFEIIRTIAGGGTVEGGAADGGPATDAIIDGPFGVAADGSGGFYFSEDSRVRKVDGAGIITTVAGTGEAGFGGDGGLATAAQLSNPRGIALDAVGALYIADSSNFRIRKVDASGIITTVAGNGVLGGGGNGGPATSAQLRPSGVYADSAGDLYIADEGNSSIRKVDDAGIITTVAGNGDTSFYGDGGPATQAALNGIKDVFVDMAGNIVIPDHNNNRIRKVDTAGIINTIVGTGIEGGAGDGGPALAAQINHPAGLDFDADGNMYFSEERAGRVRRVDTSGIITTFAGGGTGLDDVPPQEAALNTPLGVATDPTLGLLIAEGGNDRIRQVVVVPDLLGVTMTDSPDPLNLDQVVTFVVTVVNNGTGPATGVTVSDTLPNKVMFGSAVASQGRCTRVGRTVRCQLGELAAGATATATINAVATKTGFTTNTATATANEADPFSPNNSAMTRTAIGGRGCGQVLTQNARLTADIGPCPADGIIIGADRVRLNLDRYRIFGFDGPGDGTAAGIRLPGRTGVLIRNGTVSGFDAGVVLNGGRANTVSGMTIRDNVGPDDVFTSELGDGIILFDSAANNIVDNVVTGNGVFDGIGVFGFDGDDNSIRNNLVTDTIGPASGGPAGQGIIVNGAEEVPGEFITGTRVVNNVVRGNGSAGLSNTNSTDGSIENNTVEDNGLENSNGNGIGVQIGRLDPVTDTGLLIKGNRVRGNGQDGIQLSFRVQGNQIVDNISTDNSRQIRRFAGLVWFDLLDRNVNCGTNVWSGNTWGAALYRPDCVTAGGSGPSPPPPAPAPAPVAGPSSILDEEPGPMTRRIPPKPPSGG